ncbi:MAG: hypothetical protein KDK51_04380 [Deltaproteobacteria bacterium]|nr:hypothetical protein [Deltaproteobacteria bacterium]
MMPLNQILLCFYLSLAYTNVVLAGSGDPFTVSTPDTSLEIKVTTFQDYHPQKTHKKIQIRDDLLERYVTENVTIPELRLIARMREDLVQEGITKNNSEVDKKRNLKNQIFSTLTSLLTTNSTVQRMLPNGIKDVSTISIHDAVYLSGLIVAESLEYCEEMLGNQNQDSGLSSTYPTIDTEDSRNQKAIEIDHQYADEILQQGKGICRNYAPVNQVVFDFLKSKNANLINTYMKTYEPSEIGHMMFLPHAWNRVITVNQTATGLQLWATFVDPTFLDTRIDQEGPIESYNAFDDVHFGYKQTIVMRDVADLFSILAIAMGYSEESQEIALRRSYQLAAMDGYLQTSIAYAEKTLASNHALIAEMAASNFKLAVESLMGEGFIQVAMALESIGFSENILDSDLAFFISRYQELIAIVDTKVNVLQVEVVWPMQNTNSSIQDPDMRWISIAMMYQFIVESCQK